MTPLTLYPSIQPVDWSDSASANTTSTSPLNHSQEVNEKLNNYVPQDVQDDTKLFLEATLQSLPSDGKRNLEADIRASCQSDAELRALMRAASTIQGCRWTD